MKDMILSMKERFEEKRCEVTGLTSSDIRKRRKSFLVLLLAFAIFTGTPAISAFAASYNISVGDPSDDNPLDNNREALLNRHVHPGDRIIWGVKSAVEGEDTIRHITYRTDTNEFVHRINNLDAAVGGTGGTYSYIVLNLAATGLSGRGRLDYWEVTDVAIDAGVVEGITLLAHFTTADASTGQLDLTLPEYPAGEEEEPGITLPPHEHAYKLVHTIEATETTDGEYAFKCECGHVLYTIPESGIVAFLRNTVAKIEKAPANSTVRIQTSIWMTFNKAVCEALAKRPDVTLEISYLSEGTKGERYITTIPAGTDLSQHLDQNNCVGFLCLKTMYPTVHGEK